MATKNSGGIKFIKLCFLRNYFVVKNRPRFNKNWNFYNKKYFTSNVYRESAIVFITYWKKSCLEQNIMQIFYTTRKT